MVLRYQYGSRLVGAIPTRLVSLEPPALWLAPGTLVAWPSIAGRPVRELPLEERYSVPWDSSEQAWWGDGVLILARPGRAHALWHFWEAGPFAGWYVNLERCWRASRLGYDTEDHDLDIWVTPEGSWSWKDEHELDAAVRLGRFDAAQAAAIRAEGERVVEQWQFPTGWEHWRPDAAWPLPRLPDDWRL